MRLATATAVLVAIGVQRAPIVQSVDLVVPRAPVTFEEAGRTQLVHELHVTNFLGVEVSIAAVRVTSAADGRLLAEYRGAELGRAIVRPGLRHDHETPHVLGPGMRAVVNFWIALPDDAHVPQSVKHSVELGIVRPSGIVHTTVEGGAASVSKDPAIALAPPLRGGPWVALYDPWLKGGHRMAIYATDGRARIPGRFAIDWILLPRGVALVPDTGDRSTDRNGFGAEVLAVADGVVAAAMDDVADPTPKPVAPEAASGNYLAIDLGSGRVAFYEHLQRGSVAVKTGERVRRGQVVARLGGSGSTSIGPHLHLHVADANSPLGAEGLPFVFQRFEHIGAFRSLDAVIAGETWSAAEASPRALERPGPNTVVRFP